MLKKSRLVRGYLHSDLTKELAALRSYTEDAKGRAVIFMHPRFLVQGGA